MPVFISEDGRNARQLIRYKRPGYGQRNARLTFLRGSDLGFGSGFCSGFGCGFDSVVAVLVFVVVSEGVSVAAGGAAEKALAKSFTSR